ncbi:hypothetical protein AVEN_218087-1 [Araneus ventricosus]|uniref:Uncharacterized protein n=1 Tax=Araneus ventricosus TaxID=182803 RepID=A0A4Y2QSL1_ARAVE|nr:hypothetical protein AVEN_218087-1 [Araneus ventricosus]
MHLHRKDCEAYYCAQVGGGGYFRGAVGIQRGYGVFGDLKRYITPLAIKAGKYLGQHLLHTGKNVLSDVREGKSFRDAARSRLHQSSKKIRDDFFQQLHQQGKGIKRKAPRKRCQSKAKTSKARPPKAKRRKVTTRDIFG